MNKKRAIALILCGMVAVSNVACGSGNVETTAPAQETEQAEASQEAVTEQTAAEEEEQEESAETGEDVVTEDTVETEAAEEKTEEAADGGLKIGSSELEEICAKYDKVLSTYEVESYFGYNIPDGWVGDDYGVDGRQESRYIDIWTSDNVENGDFVDVYGTETVRIEGIDRAKSLGTYVTDDEGNDFIPPSDEFDYDNCYLDAIHDFYETKEWREPERPKCPVGWADEEYGYESFCPTRIYRGEIDTPYGKGILCSAVYEGVRYTGYDAETHCYTEMADTYRWSRNEEMILEIDDQFVIISYSYFEWSDLGANVDPDGLDYSGRLDEIIPQMF